MNPKQTNMVLKSSYVPFPPEKTTVFSSLVALILFALFTFSIVSTGAMEEKAIVLHEFNIGGETYIAGGNVGHSLLDLLKLEEALEEDGTKKEGKAHKQSPKTYHLALSPRTYPSTPTKTEKPKDFTSPESKKAKLKKLFSEGSDQENQSFLVADNNGAKMAFKFFQSYFRDVPQKDRVYLQHKNKFIPQAKMITDTNAYDLWECHRKALIHAAKLHHPLARKYLALNPFFLIEKDPNTRSLPSEKEELEKVLRENCLEDIGRMALFTPNGNKHLFVFFLSYFDLPRNERHFLHEETDFIKLLLATEWKDRRRIEPWGKLSFIVVDNHHNTRSYRLFKLCKRACLLAKWLNHKGSKIYYETNSSFFSVEGDPKPDSKLLRELREKQDLFKARILEAKQKKREFEGKQRAEVTREAQAREAAKNTQKGSPKILSRSESFRDDSEQSKQMPRPKKPEELPYKNAIDSCQMTIVDLEDKEFKCIEEINREEKKWREENPPEKEQAESLPCVGQFATLQTDLDVLTAEKEKHIRNRNLQAHKSILENIIYLKLTALKESDTFINNILPYFKRTQTVEYVQTQETSSTQIRAIKNTIDILKTYLHTYAEVLKAFNLGIETSKKSSREELLAKHDLTEIETLNEIETLLKDYKALLEEACNLLQERQCLLQEAQESFDRGKEDYSPDLGAKIAFYTRLKDVYLRYFEICGDEAPPKDYQLASERTFKALEDLEGTAQQKAIPDEAVFRTLKTQLVTLSIKFERKCALAWGDKPLKDNGHIKVAERYWQVLRGLTESHLILQASQIVAYHLERYIQYLENPNSPHNKGEEAAQHEFLAHGYVRAADLLLEDLSERRCIYYKKAITHLEKKIALLCTKGDWNKMRVLYMKLADAIDSTSSRQADNSEFCFHKAIACLESHVGQYPENDFGVTELAAETYIAIASRLNKHHSNKISVYCRKSIEYLEKFMTDPVAKKSLEYLPRASKIVVEAIKMNQGEPLFVERCCAILATYVDTLIKQYELFAKMNGSNQRVNPAIYKSAFETLDFAGNFLEHNPSLQLLYFVKQLNYLKGSFQNPENPTQEEKKRYFEMCFDFSSKVTNPEAMERLYDEGEQWVELYASTQNTGSSISTLSQSELNELFLNFSMRAKETGSTESAPEVSWDILIFACKAARLCSDIAARIDWCEIVHTILNESLYLLGDAYWPTQEHYALIEQVRKTLEDLQGDSANLLQRSGQQYQPLPNTIQATETIQGIPQLATLMPSTIDWDLASYLTQTTELLRDLSTRGVPVEDPKEEELLDALDSNPVHVVRSLLGNTRNEELRDHFLDFVDSHPTPDCGRAKRAECLDENDPIKKGVANHYINEAKKLVVAAKAIPIRLERLNLLYRAADLYKESLKALNNLAKPKHYSKVYLTYSSIYDLISEEWKEFIESIRVSSQTVIDFDQDLRRELPNLKGVKSASEDAIGFVSSLLTCLSENDLLCGFPFIFRNLCEEPPELSGSLEELNKLFDTLQEKRAKLSQETSELIATARSLIAQAFDHNCSIALDNTIMDKAHALAVVANNFHLQLKTETPQLEGVISTAEKTQNYLYRLATTITDMVWTLSECPPPISRSCEGLPELTEEASRLDSIVADVDKRKQELMSNVLRSVSSESTYKDFVQRLQRANQAAVLFQQNLAQYQSQYTEADKKKILEAALSTTDKIVVFLNRLLVTVSKRYFKKNIDSIFKILEEDPPSLSEASDEFESLYDKLYDKATAVDASITRAIELKETYVALGLDTKLAEAVDCASNNIYKAIDPEKAKKVAYEKAYLYQVLCIQRALPCEYIWDLFTDAIKY
ncbi:MAG: hypothetical protein K2Y18_01540, partial [Alphaproteobacteria bacterium]|nr:hypothetical protein [Alphaproteobacteria bacterium]